MRPTIGVDLDGVVIDFDRGWIERFHECFPGLKPELRPGMPQAWNALHELSGFHSPARFWHWWHESGEFRGLPLHKGAKAALHMAVRRGWHIVYATNRPTPDRYTLRELIRHGLPQPYHLAHIERKWELPVDLFVEDAPHNIEQMLAHGRDVVRVERPWNDPSLYPGQQFSRAPSIPDLTIASLRHHLNRIETQKS